MIGEVFFGPDLSTPDCGPAPMVRAHNVDALGQTSSGGPGFGTLLVLGALGVGAYYLFFADKKKTGGRQAAPSGAGWYTLLYKESPRSGAPVTERLGTLEGPFDTKAEADDVARREESIWYPKVKHYERLPAPLARW